MNVKVSAWQALDKRQRLYLLRAVAEYQRSNQKNMVKMPANKGGVRIIGVGCKGGCI